MGNQGKADPNPEKRWSVGTMGRKDAQRKIVDLGKESKETNI